MAEKRRVPKILTSQVNIYLEPDNLSHARDYGKKIFGSASSYINALIAKDRGVRARRGVWKTPGESKVIKSLKRSRKGLKTLEAVGIEIDVKVETPPLVQNAEVANEIIEVKEHTFWNTPEPVISSHDTGSDYEGVE